MDMGKLLGTIITLFVVAVLGILILSACGYVAANVEQGETGIQMYQSQITNVVGPGRYTELGRLFLDIEIINTQALRFCGEDPEVLTNDQQRIGVKVCGTVQRPDYTKSDVLQAKWGLYRYLYTDDKALVGEIDEKGNFVGASLMYDLSQQAMKSCVGDRKFEEAAVGASRDLLRTCVDERLSELAGSYGLDIQNNVVPNIAIHPTVQALLDAITEAKFQTDLAIQQAEKAKADAEKELAVQQGAIKVSQGKVQEELRQRAISAELEKAALESELQVIVQEKANELKEASLAKEVTQAELEVAQLEAMKTLAVDFARARLFQDNPAWLALTIQQAWANAWNSVDKVIVPAGTLPSTVLSPDTDVTTVIPAEPTQP